jgi:hypothetical protein
MPTTPDKAGLAANPNSIVSPSTCWYNALSLPATALSSALPCSFNTIELSDPYKSFSLIPLLAPSFNKFSTFL